MKPRLLTIKHVARLLSVSTRTVARLVERGELAPPHIVGDSCKRWFTLDVANYLAWLRKGEKEK